MDSTVVRAAMVRHRTRCAAPPDDARHSRALVRRTDVPHRTGAPATGPPPYPGAAGRARPPLFGFVTPLVQVCYQDVFP